MRRFEGRTALVTGASRGIGAATAERLAAEGAAVVITARTLEPGSHPLGGSLRETLERCRRHGGRVEAVVADLADADSRATIVPQALEVFGGRLDVLVNNAAASIHGTVGEMPLKRRRLMIEINLHAPVDLAQAALPAMLERGEGWIVNVSSRTAELAPGPPFRTTGAATSIGGYGASKAALDRITNALAVEVAEAGIRVNTVAPRAAVLSEGADALVGATLSDDQIESMEAMVESIVALCRCEPERTGRIHISLDLLDELGLDVWSLDASGPHPEGRSVIRT